MGLAHIHIHALNTVGKPSCHKLKGFGGSPNLLQLRCTKGGDSEVRFIHANRNENQSTSCCCLQATLLD